MVLPRLLRKAQTVALRVLPRAPAAAEAVAAAEPRSLPQTASSLSLAAVAAATASTAAMAGRPARQRRQAPCRRRLSHLVLLPLVAVLPPRAVPRASAATLQWPPARVHTPPAAPVPDLTPTPLSLEARAGLRAAPLPHIVRLAAVAAAASTAVAAAPQVTPGHTTAVVAAGGRPLSTALGRSYHTARARSAEQEPRAAPVRTDPLF